jgi:hypothetical protein
METQDSEATTAVETPQSKAGRCLANDIKHAIDMINELWLAMQDGGDGYEGSAFAGFGMVVTARLRVALNQYEEMAKRAHA